MMLDNIENRARALGFKTARVESCVQVFVRDRRSEIVRLDARLVDGLLIFNAVVAFAGAMSVLNELLDQARATELQLLEAATR